MKKTIFVLSLCLFVGIGIVSSCTAGRTVTVTSSYLQRGDTSVVIQTKTIETYDGKKQF